MKNFKKYLLLFLATLFLSVPASAEKLHFFGKGEGVVKGAGRLLDDALITEMRAAGVNFTKANLKFVARNNDNIIMFLEKGNPSSGLQHIIDGKWTGKPSFQALFNNNIDEMVENMFMAVKDGNYVEKIIDTKNRLSYVYKVQTTQGLKEFKFATGSNGYIVSFIPNW